MFSLIESGILKKLVQLMKRFMIRKIAKNAKAIKANRA
jgi:hypothetical protein